MVFKPKAVAGATPRRVQPAPFSESRAKYQQQYGLPGQRRATLRRVRQPVNPWKA